MNYTYKNIWLINFPVMMSILIEQLINITDAIFLGHVGEIELGASALAGIWYLAIYMLGFGFSLGLQVVIARRNGERHYSETGKTFFQGLFFLSGLAVFLCLFSKLFSPIILSRLITSAEVYHAVIDYLDGRIWGLLFSFPFLALRSFLVGITRTKALNMAALTAVLVNIPGNWLLIFHWNMGIAGAAIASSFAEACSLAVLQSMFYVKWINGYMDCVGALTKVYCFLSVVCPYGVCSIRLSEWHRGLPSSLLSSIWEKWNWQLPMSYEVSRRCSSSLSIRLRLLLVRL